MESALLFPGQGSQRVGMGRDVAREFEPARRVFEEADDALGASISRLCFEGPEDELTRTENTQPAILTCSIAVLRALEAERGLRCHVAAGHSLGEWSALVAAGALSLADAVRLVRLRGKAMQEAVPEGQGAMAAIMGLEPGDVDELCRESRGPDEVLSPANFNGAGQIVVSGHAGSVDRAVAAAKGRGAKRAVRLQVSAPFHCALMKPAAERVREALAGVSIAPLALPVVANVDARPNQDAGRVRELLVEQVTAPVRWEESVQNLAAAGVTRAVEVGAGSVLRGLVKRIAAQIEVTSVGEPHEVKALEAMEA
jgi:[acyl-carrier-protein] S-malonyltransferase